MARLTVEAVQGSRGASGMDAPPAITLCVSVVDEAGQPVEGLKKQHFKLVVLETKVGKWFGDEFGDIYFPIKFDSVSQTGMPIGAWPAGPLGPGFYHVNISPALNWWGRIVVGLAVERTRKTTPPITQKGQTVIAIEVSSA